MKAYATVFFVIQVVLIQNVCSDVIRTTAPCGFSSPVIIQPSVANTLADTLSLLTVSSLLYETLPFTPNVVTSVPLPIAGPSYAPAYEGCGCRYRNYGYNVL